MSVKRDLRALLAEGAGTPPDAEPTEMRELLDAWFDKIMEKEKDRVRSSTAPFFASDGAGCARKTAYDYLDRILTEPSLVPASPGKSNPPSLADHWTFNLGNLVHDEIQGVGGELGYDNEVRAVLAGLDGEDLVSTRIDMLRVLAAVAVELKSKNGYGFKMMATTFRGDPQGPNYGHVVQLALSIRALRSRGAVINKGVLIYLSLEKLSPDMAKDFANDERSRVAAQWSFGIEELDELADKVLDWLGRIKKLLDEGALPPRVFLDADIPKTAFIVDPTKGTWEVRSGDEVVRKGKTWMCGYCDWRDQCKADLDAGI
jgi:hypothetical protein